MFPYLRYLNAKILFTFYLRPPLQYPHKTMFCITSWRYDDNAKQHRFYYIFKQSSVCFFHMFDRLFFIMINEQPAFGRMLKCERMWRWSKHLIFPLPTVEATPLGHEDNWNCKRSAFICIHSIKKIIFAFL